MQRRSSFILLNTIVFVVSFGCQRESYPDSSSSGHVRNHHKASPGAYTKVIQKSTNKPVSGELIFIHDSLILMTDRQRYLQIAVDDIQSMTSQISGAKTKTYLLISGLTLIPMMVGLLAHSDHSNSPKAIGLMATSPGLVVALVESLKKPEIISYPAGTDLDEFRKHARFPDQLPFDPEFKELISSTSSSIREIGHDNTSFASTP